MNVSKLLGRWAGVAGLLCAGLFLAGCKSDQFDTFEEVQGLSTPGTYSSDPATASTPTPTVAAPTAAAPAPVTGGTAMTAPATATQPLPPIMNGPGAEVLHAGDSLVIVFSDTPQGIPMFEDRIKEDGTITLPLNLTFQAAGKTRGDLEKEIRARYVPNYYTHMTATIKPLDRYIYVGGEVKGPGKQVWSGPITVTKCIQSAGDFTDFAKKTKVQLIRADGTQVEVNCVKALKDPRLDLLVLPNDKIHVPRRFW